jgi:hypothetical protein
MVVRKLTYTEETTTITTTTVGCKRKAETEHLLIDNKDEDECERKGETNDTHTDAVKTDEEEEYDMFSENSKRILSTRISKRQCGGVAHERSLRQEVCNYNCDFE